MVTESSAEYLELTNSEEFLPPISRWTTLGGLFLVGTFGVAIALAARTSYNVVVRANAIVRPSGEIRLVQAASEGTVSSIHVRENQVVNQGDAIATIDDSQLQTQKNQLLGTIQQNQLQLSQLDAQIQALDVQLSAESDRQNRAIASASAELNRSKRDYQERNVTATSELQEAEANLQIAQQELQKAEAELRGIEANTKAIESALKAAMVKRDRLGSIAESGAISLDQLEEAQLEVDRQQQILASQQAQIESQQQVILQQQQAIEAATARRDRAVAALDPSSADISISQETIAEERAMGEGNLARLHQEQEELQQSKTEIETQIDQDRQTLKQMEFDLKKTVISSPETGTILKLELRNIGQFVRPGEAIAQISPSQDLLAIKAQVPAEEIGKIRICKTERVADCQEGQVQMRVSAYPYPDYGTLKGAIRAIAPDAIVASPEGSDPIKTIKNSATTSYYEVTIQSEKIELQKDDQRYPIQSGMEITAEIITQEDTLLNFVLRKAKLIADL